TNIQFQALFFSSVPTRRTQETEKWLAPLPHLSQQSFFFSLPRRSTDGRLSEADHTFHKHLLHNFLPSPQPFHTSPSLPSSPKPHTDPSLSPIYTFLSPIKAP
uniref:Uncharacterized protein n=1 Tax=Aegilops tauschii subsp. strangulata TaxID=200361 RepID=A0A452XPP7_AEGTS